MNEESLDVWELMGAKESFEEEEVEYNLDQGYFDDAGES